MHDLLVVVLRHGLEPDPFERAEGQLGQSSPHDLRRARAELFVRNGELVQHLDGRTRHLRELHHRVVPHGVQSGQHPVAARHQIGTIQRSEVDRDFTAPAERADAGVLFETQMLVGIIDARIEQEGFLMRRIVAWTLKAMLS